MNARRMAIVLLLALAEAALITPIISTIFPLGQLNAAALLLGGIWFTLFVLAIQWQALAHLNVSLSMQRLLMGVWLIVLVLIFEATTFIRAPALAPDLSTMLPGFILALVLWWRGMALGTNGLRPRDAEMHLQLGMLMLMALGVGTLFTRNEELLFYIPVFFFGALTAVPLSNLELTSQSTIGRRVPMNLGWWGWVSLGSLTIVLASLVITSLVTGRSFAQLVGLLLTLLLLPIALLMSLIPQGFFDAIAELFRRLANLFGGMPLFEGLPQSETPTTAQQALQPLPPAVNFAIAIVVFGVLVALVLIFMNRAQRLNRVTPGSDSDIEGALANDKKDAVGEDANRRFSTAALRRWLAVMTIRRLYARASIEAARRGFRRQPAQTPYDFLPALQQAFPAHGGEARTITDAYVAAHYGEVPDSPEALDALRAAWERMRSTQRVVTE